MCPTASSPASMRTSWSRTSKGTKSPGSSRSRDFEPVDKVDRLSQKCKHFFEEMQAAASHSLRSHVCGLSRVFSDAHVAVKNRSDLIPSSADDGTLRGSCRKSCAWVLFRQAEVPAPHGAGTFLLLGLFLSVPQQQPEPDQEGRPEQNGAEDVQGQQELRRRVVAGIHRQYHAVDVPSDGRRPRHSQRQQPQQLFFSWRSLLQPCAGPPAAVSRRARWYLDSDAGRSSGRRRADTARARSAWVPERASSSTCRSRCSRPVAGSR